METRSSSPSKGTRAGKGRPPLPTKKNKKKAGAKSGAKSVSKAVSAANKSIQSKAAGEAYVKVEGDATSNRFTEEEDLFICKAFVNCTTDSIRGADQKGDDFWKRVHEKLYVLYNEEAEVAIEKKWSWKSVRNRFQKTIAKSVQKFNGYYKQVVHKEKSGWTPQMYIDSAKEVWLSLEGKPFKFGDCVRNLHQVPKFNPNVDDEEEEEEDSKPAAVETPKGKSHNSIGSVQGGNMQRPTGAKKAKKAKLLEELDIGSQQSTRAMETVAGNSGRMVAAIEKRQRHDSWYKRADLFLRMGDNANAALMIQKMEEDDAKPPVDDDAKPPAIPESIEVADPNPTMRSAIDGCFDDGDSAEESDHPSQPSDVSRMFAK